MDLETAESSYLISNGNFFVLFHFAFVTQIVQYYPFWIYLTLC